MSGVLGTWLLLYVGLFALIGFVLLIVRTATDRGWSNRTLLRAASAVAFIGALVVWLLLVAVT